MPVQPSFFLCGAPRGGTTSLYSWLGQHPDIYTPRNKEPQHFAPSLGVKSHRRMRIDSSADYQALFNDALPGQIAGEGSTWHFIDPSSPERIHAFNPDAKILFVLRQPAELLFSWHGRLLESGYEELPFAEALDAEDDRRAGKRLPTAFAPREGLYYRQIGRFAEVIERYRAVFPMEQIHVEFYEDLTTTPAETYSRVLRFIGLNEAFQADFSPKNARSAPQSQQLRRWLNRPPAWIGKPLHALTSEKFRTRLHSLLC
ncbi:MAG: sulfotransferase family protein, partial [Puniceicoccales bacterium]